MKNMFSILLLCFYNFLTAQDCTQVYVGKLWSSDDEIGWSIAQAMAGQYFPEQLGRLVPAFKMVVGLLPYDGGGDGWSGSVITIFTDEVVLFNGTLNDGNHEVNDANRNSEPCLEPSYGCEYEGLLYQFGTSIQQDCNSCFCEAVLIQCKWLLGMYRTRLQLRMYR